MKTTSSLLAGAVAAAVLAASPLTFAQTASSAPENNKTDSNMSNGSMGDATPPTNTTAAPTIATPTNNNKTGQAMSRNMDANTQAAAPAPTSNTPADKTLRTSTVTAADKKQNEKAVAKQDNQPAPNVTSLKMTKETIPGGTQSSEALKASAKYTTP